MARIAGVDLPLDKRVEIGLTYIYGIGVPTSQKILKACDIDGDIRVKDLSEDQINAIREMITNGFCRRDLRRNRLEYQKINGNRLLSGNPPSSRSARAGTKTKTMPVHAKGRSALLA